MEVSATLVLASFSSAIPPSSRPISRAVATSLIGAVLLGSALCAQPGGTETSLQELEAQLEQVFAAALEMSDRDNLEPLHFLQGWGAAMMSATMLEARRAQAEGRSPDHEGAQEALLERWQTARPGSAGPELFRLFQIQDQEARVPGLLALADRHPDDPQLLWQIGQSLRSFGRADEVTERLEAHVARNPESGSAWRLLVDHYGSLQNETRQAEALVRWAELAPGDPALVERWLGAGLDRRDPEASARLIAPLLERPRDDPRVLEICGRLARGAESPHRQAARRCVARFASRGEVGTDGAPPLGERAIALLAELAAAEGDWAALIDSLESLDPPARGRVLVASAARVEVPARCSERIELLRAAFDGVRVDGTDASSGLSSIASSARGCAGRPAARELFLELLDRAPAMEVPTVLGAWVFRVNETLRGELPADVGPRLEARLEQEPEAPELYRALATVYELRSEHDRRFEILRRFAERAPESMRGPEAADLAWELLARGEAEEAADLLERRLARAFTPEEAELLWQIRSEPIVAEGAEWPDEAAWLDALERADRWAGELASSADPYRSAFGHLLVARVALLREDAAAAERHYLEAIRRSEAPLDDWVKEAMQALAEVSSGERLGEIALEICGSTSLTQRHRGRDACATAILAGSGKPEALASLASTRELPADEPSLRALASGARDADPGLAERAWVRLLELDPLDDDLWTSYAGFLTRQGRLEDVEALLPRVRERFEQPTTAVLRAVAQARLVLGRLDGAIELLEEAREALPAGADPAWLDADVREVHAAIGRQDREAEAARSPRGTVASLRPLSDAEAALLEAEVAAAPDQLLAVSEALRTGTPVAGLPPDSLTRYDPVLSRAFLERAALAGDPLAVFRLALEARRTGSDAVALAVRSAVEQLARQGDGYARYLLGTGALLGIGVERDLEAARRWLDVAASPGPTTVGTPAMAWARHNLAWMAEVGQGTEPDPLAAIDGYRRAGDLGNVASLYDFARLTLNSPAPELCREGLERLERAAGAGHLVATAYLGKTLLYGSASCVEAEAERARPWLERAAEGGDGGARYDLGLLLLLSAREGDATRGLDLLEDLSRQPFLLAVETLQLGRVSGAFVPRDAERARTLRAEAARLGSDGLLRLRGEVVFGPGRRLFEEATARLERLVAGGDVESLAPLAWLLLEGPFDSRDPARGVSLARQAAATGDGWALRLLANAYRRGHGVEADPVEGLRLTRAAAQAGDSFAMAALAAALFAGESIDPDPNAGLEWLERAAESGLWSAVGELGRLYAEGRPGLPARPELAVPWKRQRAALGDDEARGWLLSHGFEVR